MAEPNFTSQQSEILINVSENHSSAKSSPLAEPHAHVQTHVEQSPSIQASSGEVFVPESAERVQDSYQDSLRYPVPTQLIENDDDEDLYTVSPSGKAKLQIAIAAVKRTQEEQVR
jgi:hypothetical protein